MEVANYLQKILNFSMTPSSMYKQEANVHTDSYLQNSKLMEADSDEEDENASGILKHRPRLWVELVKKLCSKKWWDHLTQLQSKSLLLPALKTMHETDKLALPVFDGKNYKGILDCMELSKVVIEAWNAKPPIPTSPRSKGAGGAAASRSNQEQQGVMPFLNLNSVAGIATNFCYKEVDEALGERDPISCLKTSQFSWNLLHRFAQGARTVPISTASPPTPTSLVFIMHPCHIAEYFDRNMDMLPHSDTIRNIPGITRKVRWREERSDKALRTFRDMA